MKAGKQAYCVVEIRRGKRGSTERNRLGVHGTRQKSLPAGRKRGPQALRRANNNNTAARRDA